VSFLGLSGKTILIQGVANKKSVAYAVDRVLRAEGADCVHLVRSEARKAQLQALLPDSRMYVLDVEDPEALARTATSLRSEVPQIDGYVHSIAFANYEGGFRPFHQTPRNDFLQAVQISCHSFIELAGALLPNFADDASLVTISISTTRMAAENYGYMGPIKAALDSSVVFLAKSLSQEKPRMRVNAVGAGLLKTSASAGIPGYVDSYLFAEKATLRKAGVLTDEVANTVAFLLSHRASGINAQHLVVDAGMGVNYFDRALLRGSAG
jgi:enoyl-[acyl-carrier protein] reductase I